MLFIRKKWTYDSGSRHLKATIIYYQRLYTNHFAKKARPKDKFLKKYALSKLTQEIE